MLPGSHRRIRPALDRRGSTTPTPTASQACPTALSGYPHITVPAGYIGGLSVGLSFMGTRWSEPQLLGFAFDFEQATHVRVPPQFLPSTPGLSTATAKHGANGAAARDQARRMHLR